MKEKLLKLGLSEEDIDSVMAIVKRDYVSMEKYNSEKAALNDRIAALTAESKEKCEKYEADIKGLKIDSAIDMAVAAAGAKTGKAVKALIDMDKIGFDDKGNVTGVREQVKSLAESDETAYLFNSEKFKGVSIGSSSQEPGGKAFEDMSYSEMCSYMEENPGVVL